MARKKPSGWEDDAALLAHVFNDVTPLPGRSFKAANKSARLKPPVKRRITRPAPPPPQSGRAHLPELSHGTAPGVDKRTAQRLKRGKLEIDARLDLHGHTQATGHQALASFIDGAYGARKRCVLVITGKGYQDGPGGGRVGVLRQAVPGWLNQSPTREKILSFNHAAPADGGTGALYILLKRKR